MANILVVEDEENIAHIIKTYLEQSEHDVRIAADGDEALELFATEIFSLAILDVMLPKLSGFDLCRRIRTKSNIPILMLTARVGEDDRIAGFEAGADDYIVKPFNPRELVARVQANLRRVNEYDVKLQEKLDTIIVGNIKIDIGALQAHYKDMVLNLTAAEFRVLTLLAKHPGIVFSREKLLAQIGEESSNENLERTVDTHIKNIRRKLSQAGCEECIETVRGFGYRLSKETK